MKRALAKKLELRAQVVRLLTVGQLGRAAGGVPTGDTSGSDLPTCNTGPTTTCGPITTVEP